MPALPVIPGHELGGVIEAVGSDVREFAVGDRVRAPFHEACGPLPLLPDLSDEPVRRPAVRRVHPTMGYAEYAKILNADFNCVRLPEGVDSLAAAAIGHRYMTAYHAVMHQVGVQPGQWVAVHGTGGVGLSAVQIASAIGAQTIAVDIDDAKLKQAVEEGAVATVNGNEMDVAEPSRRSQARATKSRSQRSAQAEVVNSVNSVNS